MFREMRRKNQQVSEADCKNLLREEKRAAFSVLGEHGYPYTIPINFYYDEGDGKIYFHGSKTGHKADAISNCTKVCLTVWNQGYKKEGCWEWNATSVVIFGKVHIVHDPSVINDKLRKLTTKYYPSQEEVDKAMASPSMNCVQLFAIDIEHMTGKLVNEK